MRTLVLGGGGMLGHKLTQVLGTRGEVWATATGGPADVAHFTGIPSQRVLPHFDVLDDAQLRDALDSVRPDVVVNAVGLVKQSQLIADHVLTDAMNVSLPRRIAREATSRSIRMVHFSTDCVFSGKSGGYVESDVPDADDDYGRSKALGETELGDALVIRTSAIGREIRHFHGLVEWLLRQPGGQVPGFSEAYWSGLPTITFARLVGELMETAPGLTGTYHLASNRINKFDLLQWINEALGSPWAVVPVAEPALDRSLDGSRLVADSGIRIPVWPDLVEELVRDSRRHDELKAAR
ncbi:MAG: sugar nucleotide-binding protein [Actinobacteria bacterium]|nr:sugar nucleotide-binding protein [Actinomycetota bacterium]